MYKEIEKFLEFLKIETKKPFYNGENKDKCFTIKPYNASNHKCEIAEVFGASQKAIETFKSIYNNDYFELHHPFYNEILTRAVHSYRFCNNWYYVVFFIDKENKYPWMLVVTTTMYCLVTKDGFFSDCHFKDIFFGYQEKIGAEKLIRNETMNAVKNINLNQLVYRDQKFIPTIFNSRPWHFFVEGLPLALLFKLKKLNNENMFFKPKSIEFINDKDKIVIPVKLDRDQYAICFKDQKWKNEVIKDSLEYANLNTILIKEKFDLIVWFGIPGERRYWLEQLEGIPNILKNLAKYFPKMKVYIDGMTAYEGASLNVDDNKRAFFDIKKEVDKLNLEIDLVSLAGCEYKTKIAHASLCDIYIGDIGTTLFVPCLILNKPGVIFHGYNAQFSRDLKFVLECNKTLYQLDNKYIHSKENGKFYGWDFNILWQALYNLSADVLEKIKNIKMHRLDVPPVEILVLRAKVNALSAEINRLKAGNATSMSATERIQNHLSYKLGRLMIENSRSIFGWIKMPFSIIGTIKEHKLLTKLANKITKLPKIETLPDYKEALKYKNHMSYKLGEAFLKINKNWHKGGPIWFICEAIKINSKRKA